MNRSSSPGIGQWVTVSVMVVVTIFLILKLYQYAGFRQYYPAGLTIAGVDVGGLTRDETSALLTNRYLDAPLTIYHGEQPFTINPSQAKFVLDRETMLSQADYQRAQQDFWAGFWGFIWNRPVEVAPVALSATHDRESLREVMNEIAVLSDKPSQPPQPIPDALSFQYGAAGTETQIEASFADVEAALYRPTNREAYLTIDSGQVLRPELNLLTRLIVNHLQDFTQFEGGVASVFLLDLATGEEIVVNSDVAMSGLDLLRVPIALETYRAIDQRLTISQQRLISDTLSENPENESANSLLQLIGGGGDGYVGAEMTTASLERLGLASSFIAAPYGETIRNKVTTPANSAEGLLTNPVDETQTTAEEMSILLSMIYYCAEGQGGAIAAAFDGEITQGECADLLTDMQGNQIESLIEEGVPAETAVSHRHNFGKETHSDTAIVYTPAGDYVLTVMLYKPDWLEWETSSTLIADISRATYNYFNFDNPYLDN